MEKIMVIGKQKNLLNSKEFLIEEKFGKNLGYRVNFSNARKAIKETQNKIKNEKTDEETIEKLLTKLIRLSPKKTGLFFETFNRHENDLLPSNNTFFDALTRDNKTVEIKASRALNFIEDEPDNLFEQIIDSGSEFISFEDAFTKPFDCNIQQVKTGEFDILNYSIFFSDVILEFTIKAQDIKNDNVEISLHKLAKDVSKIKTNEARNILNSLDKFDWTKSRRLNYFCDDLVSIFSDVQDPKLIDLFQHSGVLSEAYKNFKLGYSDKQHKGNIGEGQFHITNRNIIFHLENNFVKAHSYHDFIQVLKNTKVKKDNNEYESSERKIKLK